MEITKSELQELYDNNSNLEVCEKFGISEPTLHKLLKDNDIKKKGSGNPYYRKKIKVIG